MRLESLRLAGTTNSGGALTVVGERGIFGLLYAVQWIDGDLADGVDAVISTIQHEAASTLLTLTNANDDALYFPRVAAHNTAGAAIEDVNGDITPTLPLVVGVPQLVVSSGGNAKTGGCILFYYEMS